MNQPARVPAEPSCPSLVLREYDVADGGGGPYATLLAFAAV